MNVTNKQCFPTFPTKKKEKKRNDDLLKRLYEHLLGIKKNLFILYLNHCQNFTYTIRTEFHFDWKRQAKQFDFRAFSSSYLWVFGVMMYSLWFF